MLKLLNISKSYQGNKIIHDLSYFFEQQRYCIVGANGSGKTTLLMLAAGLEKVCSGEVTFDSQPVGQVQAKRLIGISSDKILLPEFLTPKQLLEYHCASHGCLWPTALIQALNFSLQLTTPVNALSLGNLKKISLLLALAHQPKCVLLDEPTTGLDQESKAWLLAYIEQYSGQIIITSHEECFVKNRLFQQIAMSQLSSSGVG